MPLDPNQGDDNDSGPSTADIIASQSQDYVDEKLAEYQATIFQLMSEFFHPFLTFEKSLIFMKILEYREARISLTFKSKCYRFIKLFRVFKAFKLELKKFKKIFSSKN